jgi:hypothetical protein
VTVTCTCSNNSGSNISSENSSSSSGSSNSSGNNRSMTTAVATATYTNSDGSNSIKFMEIFKPIYLLLSGRVIRIEVRCSQGYCEGYLTIIVKITSVLTRRADGSIVRKTNTNTIPPTIYIFEFNGEFWVMDFGELPTHQNQASQTPPTTLEEPTADNIDTFINTCLAPNNQDS